MSNDPRVRIETAKKILENYWPKHYCIWINGVEDYNKINWLMSQKDKEDILICQTEEDWFYSHKVDVMRRRILKSGYWTESSFIITNSVQDWEISKEIINTKLKPGILDLISYLPYNESTIEINLDDISFHTAYLYDHRRYGRDELAKAMKQQSNKVAVLKTFDTKINNLYNLDDNVFFKGKQDAPNVNIEQDYEIFKNCAFVMSFETFNGLMGEPSEDTYFQNFSPTLSEKTYKSMHMLRPALVFGGYNSRGYLRNLGFDTWDWLIDWRYDQEINPYLRFNLFLKEVDRIFSIDINELKNILYKHLDKLYYNRERLQYLIKNYDKDLFQFN